MAKLAKYEPYDVYKLGLQLDDIHFLDEYYRSKDEAKAYMAATGKNDCTRQNALYNGRKWMRDNKEKYSLYLSMRSKEDQEKHQLSLDKSLYLLSCIATTNYMDFFKKKSSGELVLDIENTTFEQQMAIKSIKQKKIYKGDDCWDETTELELYNKHDAIRDYIRHHGGFVDKVELVDKREISEWFEHIKNLNECSKEEIGPIIDV